MASFIFADKVEKKKKEHNAHQNKQRRREHKKKDGKLFDKAIRRV